MATVLNADGSGTENVRVRNFQHAQKIVGGMVEVVRLAERVLFVHEEAIPNGEPLNTTATVLAGQTLFGTVIVLDGAEAERLLR